LGARYEELCKKVDFWYDFAGACISGHACGRLGQPNRRRLYPPNPPILETYNAGLMLLESFSNANPSYEIDNLSTTFFQNCIGFL